MNNVYIRKTIPGRGGSERTKALRQKIRETAQRPSAWSTMSEAEK